MTEAIWVEIIGAAGAVLAAIIAAFALWQTRKTHILINSRMDELLATKISEATLVGEGIGEKRERKRAAREET